ncbi:hypothetical protein MASR2M69_08560 [Bacteroidota bacterium]
MKSSNNSILALQHSGGGSSNFIFKDDEAELKSIWIEIPDYCHLHCDYCYASTDNKPKKVDQYLFYSDYEKILREFAVLGGKFVGIPGKGEPFHSKNWELTKSIIDLCCQLNLELAIFTTGDAIFFTSHDTVDAVPAMEKMEYMKDKNLILLIKCNSMIPKIQNKLVNDRHNKYTQLRNRAINILINEYKLNESHRLGIVTSVMKDNENEIVDLYNWAQERNIIFDCDTILERGRGKEFTSSGQVPPKIDLEAVFKRLKKVGAITNCQGGTYVGSTCDRIIHHLYISVEGDIFPCIGCLREDIKESFQLGNIKDLSLDQAWKSRFRQRLANDYKQVFLGTCKNCQNLEDESCYSCLGRCTSSVEEDIFIHTTGCIHHKPITTTWLATVVDYIRKILSFKETKYILNNEGLERLWRPNKNIAFSILQLSKDDRKSSIKELIELTDPQDHPDYAPYKLITDSRVDNFSKKKHFNFREISFPMNKVWDFSADPNKIFEGIDIEDKEKNKVIKEISHSFLSNIFLASFKILFEKYDDSDELIRYCNFMLYDSINKKYFYRSIMKDSDSDKSGIRSLIISRWYEDLGHRNFWKEYCYDLSESFSDEIYGEYELKLSNNNKDNERSLTRRTIDLTNILELPEIRDKVENFFTYTSDENPDFKDKYKAVANFINIHIFTELLSKHEIVKNLTTLYETINVNAFYPIDDIENTVVLNKLNDAIENLDEENPVSKKLKEEFIKVRNDGYGTKFFNYFIYLGIMQKVFDVNYYYLLHSTNFSTINTEKHALLLADSEFRGVIKPSGILLCTQKQIDLHFRSELKLFISSIFAPFDEFYFTQLYGKVHLLERFKREIQQVHAHTVFNLLPYSNVNNIRAEITPLLNNNENSKNLSEIDKSLKQLSFQLNELNYVLHAALESTDTKDRKFKEISIQEIISNLKTFYEGRCTYIITYSSQDVPLVKFFNMDAQYAFTIIWNAWNNAIKHSTDNSFNLLMNNSADSLELIFSNNFESYNKELVKVLNGDTIPKVYSSGCMIIKNLCDRLNWKISVFPNEETKEYKLTLKIPKNI